MNKPVVININIKYLIKEVKTDEILKIPSETITKIINSSLENLKSDLSKCGQQSSDRQNSE